MSETLFIGKEIIELDVVDSTNNYLSELQKSKSIGEGLVVMAYYQTAGRGQRGSKWISQPGENLTFSIALKPKFLGFNNHFILSKIVSLAICKYLKKITFLDEVKIKWPNDIYVGQNKIAGILIENQFKGDKIVGSIIGIGMNVNQTNFGDLKATSLKLLTQKEHNLTIVLKEVLRYIESDYLKLRTNTTIAIEKEYLKNLLYYNEYYPYIIEGNKISGKITGVMPDGKLKMELQSGKIQLYDLKEVEFIL